MRPARIALLTAAALCGAGLASATGARRRRARPHGPISGARRTSRARRCSMPASRRRPRRASTIRGGAPTPISRRAAISRRRSCSRRSATPAPQYNRGNALADSGQLQAALVAYDAALKQARTTRTSATTATWSSARCANSASRPRRHRPAIADEVARVASARARRDSSSGKAPTGSTADRDRSSRARAARSPPAAAARLPTARRPPGMPATPARKPARRRRRAPTGPAPGTRPVRRSAMLPWRRRWRGSTSPAAPVITAPHRARSKTASPGHARMARGSRTAPVTWFPAARGPRSRSPRPSSSSRSTSGCGRFRTVPPACCGASSSSSA